MTRLCIVLSVIAGAACSNSNNSGPDAKVFHDAAGSGGATVQTVSCTGITPAQTVTATTSTPYSYQPSSVTITQGQVVEFMMPSIHNVAPNSTGSDPGLTCNFGATCCLMFTAKGTFGYHCTPHGFTGTVTVN